MGLRQQIENNAVVWFLGAVIGGFGAGIGAYQGVLEIGKFEVVSRERMDRYEMLLTKDRFTSLYLRYALAHLPPFEFQTSDEDRVAARENLDEYILEYVDEADKVDSMVAIGKGQGRQTVVKFPDGSEWAVPPGFRGAEAP